MRSRLVLALVLVLAASVPVASSASRGDHAGTVRAPDDRRGTDALRPVPAAVVAPVAPVVDVPPVYPLDAGHEPDAYEPAAVVDVAPVYPLDAGHEPDAGAQLPEETGGRQLDDVPDAGQLPDEVIGRQVDGPGAGPPCVVVDVDGTVRCPAE
jgi:hypothetical protein